MYILYLLLQNFCHQLKYIKYQKKVKSLKYHDDVSAESEFLNKWNFSFGTSVCKNQTKCEVSGNMDVKKHRSDKNTEEILLNFK